MTTKNLLYKKATPNTEAAGMSVAIIVMVSKTKNGVVFLDEILVIRTVGFIINYSGTYVKQRGKMKKIKRYFYDLSSLTPALLLRKFVNFIPVF